MTSTVIKTLNEVVIEDCFESVHPWNLRLIKSEDCLSYVVWNEESREVLYIDPKKDDMSAYLSIKNQLDDYCCLGVVDTHTHADHVSCAVDLSKMLDAPLFMHCLSPSSRTNLKIVQRTSMATRAGRVVFLPTPGHTPDSLCLTWGPFIFTGDTVLYNDVGRDDLPGGDPAAHYESLSILKEVVNPQMFVLPGHDARGGRISKWVKQLESNVSLKQGRELFIQEAGEFDAPAPSLFKKSLFENMK